MHVAVGAELDEAVARLRERSAACPHRARRGDLGDVEFLSGPHGHGPGHRLDVEHVAGLPSAAGVPTRKPLRWPTVKA